MSLTDTRVAVVGGSIAGCAMAVALRNAGCEPVVFERSRGALLDRGAGITMPVPVRDVLVAAGYLDADLPTIPVTAIDWLVRVPGSDGGRHVGTQPFPALATNWAVLWRALRARVPEGAYRAGRAVAAVTPEGPAVTLDDGSAERFDAVVGADGYRSLVRALLGSPAEPSYAGYVLWRGDLPHDASRWPIADRAVAVGFPGGHAVFYRMPDPAGAGERLNWGLYAPPPPGLTAERAMSLPRGSLDDGLVAEARRLAAGALPPVWAGAVRATPGALLHVQPIYDQTVPAYADGRVLLAGDAGALARPHTGSGAVKAMQDALALERACREEHSWEAAAARYDAERRTFGNALVELGRSLGRQRVEAVPDLARMSPEGFAAWLDASLDGRQNPYAPR
ncbi:FAD-dependent monooxygenase [Actinomadura kijaniata]|uniref:FAD-dependent monooxygenase n=1 Tax=Actinomadura kijaniata TaxID=46161 RepID=UPI003F1C6A72